MVQNKEAEGVTGYVTIGPAFIARTTILGFRALLGSRLGIRVTTRRAASHRARGTRCARCHAAFRGTSGRLGLYPSI